MNCELISSFRDIVVAGAAVASICIAWRGLRTWQREMRGKVNYELARRILKASYRVRDAFGYVRNHTEYLMIQRSGRLPEEQAVIIAEVFQENLEVLSEAVRDLEVEALEAKVLWGPKLEALMKKIMDYHFVLCVSVEGHIDAIREPKKIKEEERERLLRIVYSRSGRDDEVAQDIEKTIKDLEAKVRPYLGR